MRSGIRLPSYPLGYNLTPKELYHIGSFLEEFLEWFHLEHSEELVRYYRDIEGQKREKELMSLMEKDGEEEEKEMF